MSAGSARVDPLALRAEDGERLGRPVDGSEPVSAALVLGRAPVRALVIDAGEPSNRVAPAIGGLLGQDGTSPSALYAAGREQLTARPTVELRDGVVSDIERTTGGFRAALAGGETLTAGRVLLAGGMR